MRTVRMVSEQLIALIAMVRTAHPTYVDINLKTVLMKLGGLIELATQIIPIKILKQIK
jgi:hypothetical protein